MRCSSAVEAEGLGDLGEDAGLEHLCGVVRRLLAGHDDDRDGRVEHPNLLEQAKAGESFHLWVEHDEIGSSP